VLDRINRYIRKQSSEPIDVHDVARRVTVDSAARAGLRPTHASSFRHECQKRCRIVQESRREGGYIHSQASLLGRGTYVNRPPLPFPRSAFGRAVMPTCSSPA